MALSKPRDFILELIGVYFSKIYTSPIKTKAFTSCIIAALGNFISQKIAGRKHINTDSLLAFALFGLIFGGPVPHYFNQNAYRFIKHPLSLLLSERFIFMPCFQAFYLYVLPLLEGKTHEESMEQMRKLYPDIVVANLKYISLLQYINFRFVPPMLRILLVNFIDLAWIIYITKQRIKLANNETKTGKSTKSN